MSQKLGVIIEGDASGAVAALGKTAAATDKLDTSLKKISKSSNSVGFALTNVSRVAQDAPFGFIGIANNLDPLLASFSQLSKESGGAGNALKALGAGLLGPAGLAVGFSVVSSLIVTAIQKYGSLGAALNAIFSSTSAAAQATRDLNKAYSEAGASAESEIVTLNSLIGIAKDKSLADNVRQQAIDKLNKEYGKYLPNLNLENIATDKIKESTDKLTLSIIRRAKIAGVQALITKNAEREAEAYLDIANASEDAKGGITSLIDAFLRSSTGVGLLDRKAASFNKTISASEARALKFQEALDKLLKEDAAAGTLFTKPESAIKKIGDSSAESSAKVKELTAAIVNFRDLANLEPKQEKNRFSAADLFGKQKTPQFLIDADKQAAETKAKIDALTTATTNLSDALTTTLAPAFSTLFSDIISGSNNAFKSFGQAIKGVITKLIAAAITAAVFAAIISVAFGGSKKVFVDLVLFTKSFKNIFSQLSGLNLKGVIPKFASGTRNFGGGLALVGERGPELVNLPRGSDVIPNGMIGGGQRQELYSFITNRGIYLSNQRGGIAASRLG